MNVGKVLLIEGAVNLMVTVAKATVGVSTGSMALLADAFHSITDLVNNLITYLLHRVARKPADSSHPYGHRKFEYLGIFVLALLLCVVAVELIINVIFRVQEPPTQSTLGLIVIIGSMVASFAVSLFERYWGKKLNAMLLLADAKHTFADTLTTVAAIVGWQAALLHVAWLDKAVALVIVAIVLYMAYGLFKQAIPVLVDQAMVNEASLSKVALGVPGVKAVGQVRSRSTGKGTAVDISVEVDAQLSTKASHDIANELEATLIACFDLVDVLVHIEPHE
ncbi:cation transporter [Alteromonas sediminis]|uniref:Cation transporter n=1 Tax=Alteromonas sediminis TaxID=2259342 RepID=A0A3N5XYZ6_9ALTE|nr:cation diffusion facilitator family transporter [Alteromonas sediminis]RPJ65910.1 cation transporter [Alteromonas sediminis]